MYTERLNKSQKFIEKGQIDSRTTKMVNYLKKLCTFT